MKFGDYVKKLREDRGLSGAEFARLADLSEGYVSLVESNKRLPSKAATLKKYARGLDISVNELSKYLKSDRSVYEKPKRSLHGLIKELTVLESNIIEVPVVAELHMPGEIIEYTYATRTRPGTVNYVGVKAKGYCLEPQIMDGDILIIDKDAQPEIGKTVLCYHNGNEHPALIKVTKKNDLANCEIYGVVLWIMKKP